MKTKIIGVNEKHVASKAVTILKKGGIIVYPTETCYGLGADITNKVAVRNVFAVKKRTDKNISMIVSGLKMARRYTKIGKTEIMLAKKFLPGPLTIIREEGKSFRMPKNQFILNVVKKFGKPITGTSANISGKNPIYKIAEIKKHFYGNVDLIIDAGDLPKKRPSTVFNTQTKNIIRRGSITKREIMKCLNNS